MPEYVASQMVKQMIKKEICVKGAHILVLGITFKENCTDIRNSKVVDLIHCLKEYEANVTVYDPWANPEEVKYEYGLDILTEMPKGQFDAVVVAVGHKEFDNVLLKGKVIYRVK
jgi:UDP-N-acetyl-D-galactosamine dehydrogenase